MAASYTKILSPCVNRVKYVDFTDKTAIYQFLAILCQYR